MGLKDEIINNMTKTKKEISKIKYESILEKVIEDMYQKGVSLPSNDKIGTLKKEIEMVISNQREDKETIESYKKVLDKINNLEEEEKKKLEQRLENELEVETPEENKRGESER